MGHSHSHHHQEKTRDNLRKSTPKNKSFSDETVNILRNAFNSILDENNNPHCKKFIVCVKKFMNVNINLNLLIKCRNI